MLYVTCETALDGLGAKVWSPVSCCGVYLSSQLLWGHRRRHFPVSIQGVRDIDLALCFTQCVSELSLSILNCEDTAAFQLPHKRVLLDRLLVSGKGGEWVGQGIRRGIDHQQRVLQKSRAMESVSSFPGWLTGSMKGSCTSFILGVNSPKPVVCSPFPPVVFVHRIFSKQSLQIPSCLQCASR